MQQSTTQIQRPIEPWMSERFYLPDRRVVWDDVRPGLEQLLAQQPGTDWTVDSVSRDIDEHRAILMVDTRDHTSFAVVRFTDYPYSEGEREMFVHIIYCQSGDAFARWHPHFEAFARHAGARYMRFYSRRRAFLRIASRIGYQMRAIEYVKELSHG